MDFSKLNLEFLRSVPLAQKAGVLALILAGIAMCFYWWVVEPMNAQLLMAQRATEKLDKQIKTLTIKAKHLEELEAANRQLEIEIAKKKERLPPKEEAVMLLKQLTDLAERVGLEIKSWRPGKQELDGSKLFMKMTAKVEVAGGYHTVALFFDRVSKLPRIIKVSNLSMGVPQLNDGRVIIKTIFEVTAFAAAD